MLASVIIIAGTGRPFLRHAIKSLITQTESDWEAIVVEACNDPEAVAKIREQVAECPDLRVRLVPYNGPPCPDFPPYASRKWNSGLRRATGEIVCFLDDDDMKTPEWISRMCQPIVEDPSLATTTCRGTTMGADGVRIGAAFGQHNLDFAHLAAPNFVTMGQIAVRRSVLEELGGFDETLGCSEDWEMCMRLSRYPWRAIDAESLKRDGVGNACYNPEVSTYTQETLRHIILKHGLAADNCRACGGAFKDEQPDPRYVRAMPGEGFRLWHSGCCTEFFAAVDRG